MIKLAEDTYVTSCNVREILDVLTDKSLEERDIVRIVTSKVAEELGCTRQLAGVDSPSDSHANASELSENEEEPGKWTLFYKALFGSDGRLANDKLYKATGRIMRDALYHGYSDADSVSIESMAGSLNTPKERDGRMYKAEKVLLLRVGTSFDRTVKLLSLGLGRSEEFITQHLHLNHKLIGNKPSAYNLMEKVWARLSDELSKSVDFGLYNHA